MCLNMILLCSIGTCDLPMGWTGYSGFQSSAARGTGPAILGRCETMVPTSEFAKEPYGSMRRIKVLGDELLESHARKK